MSQLLTALLFATTFAFSTPSHALDFNEIGVQLEISTPWQASQEPKTQAEIKGTADDPYKWRWHLNDPNFPLLRISDPLRYTKPDVIARCDLVSYQYPKQMDFLIYSTALIRQRGLKISSMPSRQELGINIPFSTGYVAEQSTPSGRLIRFLIVHAKVGDNFVELYFSSPDEKFKRLESQFLEIAKSLTTLAKTGG